MMAKRPSKKQFQDQMWRLNNLYCITDADAKHIKFMMNWCQLRLYDNMWYLNIILKARQMGFTTFIDLFIFDTVLFNRKIKAGIIAHNVESAKVILRDKVVYAYDHLPEGLRNKIGMKRSSAEELVFTNGSSLRVSTSYRSGTLQILHVSEFGKIAVELPQRATEIVTGAFEAVGKGQMIFVESTAEGHGGYFFDMCEVARNRKIENRKLTVMDFDFHFFAWHENAAYTIDPTDMVIHPRMGKYFDKLRTKHEIPLTDGQKHWYIKKEARLGDKMKREHPSYVDEAFEQAMEGTYWAPQMVRLREDGRIRPVPHKEGVAVDTWWDIGHSDYTSIVFTQTVNRMVHIIDYYQNVGFGASHYAKILLEKREELGYRYGHHTGPHDLDNTQWGEGKTIVESARAKGINFQPPTARISDKQDAIEAGREFFEYIVIDETLCDELIKCFDNYGKEWDAIRGRWKDKPSKVGGYSDGADAYMELAKAHDFSSLSDIMVEKKTGNKSTRRSRRSAGWT